MWNAASWIAMMILKGARSSTPVSKARASSLIRWCSIIICHRLHMSDIAWLGCLVAPPCKGEPRRIRQRDEHGCGATKCIEVLRRTEKSILGHKRNIGGEQERALLDEETRCTMAPDAALFLFFWSDASAFSRHNTKNGVIFAFTCCCEPACLES